MEDDCCVNVARIKARTRVQVTLRVAKRKKRDSPVFKYNNPVN
jgi:hypothetical protein